MKYPQQTYLPKSYLEQKINEFLIEDAPAGDYTTNAIFDHGQTSKAMIQAQEDLVFVGEQIINSYLGDCSELELFYHDGQWVKKNDILAQVEGRICEILLIERSLLNLLQRLCGIATVTKKYVEIAEPYDVRILDTRKTTPGLRLFEKYAVASAGGYNHRFDLSSGILIKDNHINAAGGIREAVKKIKKKNYTLGIEVEVETVSHIEEALSCQVDGILLDNMTPGEVNKAVEVVKSHPLGSGIFIEASGGINLKTVEAYVKTGVDALSIGALTHQIRSLDIHMEF